MLCEISGFYKCIAGVQVFRDVTPCLLVNSYWRFRVSQCLHILRQAVFSPFSYDHFWQIHSPLTAKYRVTALRQSWRILGKITTQHKINLQPVSYFLWWRSWLRHVTTNRKVAGLITDGVVKVFLWHNPSGRTMALELTPAVTEKSTSSISRGVKVGSG